MRSIWLIATLTLASNSAYALESSDTMKAWRKAGAAERTEFLDRVLGKRRSKGELAIVRRCLDEASAIPGHAGLRITALIEGCSATGDPV